jgi:hypothetical protein
MEKDDLERFNVGIGGSEDSWVSKDDLNVRVEDRDFNDFDLCGLLLLDINFPLLCSSLCSNSHLHPSYFTLLWLAFLILIKWIDLDLSQPQPEALVLALLVHKLARHRLIFAQERDPRSPLQRSFRTL